MSPSLPSSIWFFAPSSLLHSLSPSITPSQFFSFLMANLLNFVMLLLLVNLLVGGVSAACEAYKGSFCQEITSQYPAGIYVGKVPQEALEDYLETSSLRNVTMIFIYYPQCRFATLRRYCTQLFPPCDSTNTGIFHHCFLLIVSLANSFSQLFSFLTSFPIHSLFLLLFLQSPSSPAKMCARPSSPSAPSSSQCSQS